MNQHRQRNIVLAIGTVACLLLILSVSWTSIGLQSRTTHSLRPLLLHSLSQQRREDVHPDEDIWVLEHDFTEALPPVAKRVWPFSSSTYSTYQGKGCKLWSMLQDRENIPSTAYTQVGDLTIWGWVNSPDNTADRISSLLTSIKDPLESLGLSVGADKNVDIHSDHSAQGGPDGTYAPTKAKYYEVYNPTQGAIVAYRNYGPASYTSHDPNSGDKPLPKLKQFSDIVFLTWLSITTADERESLKYIVRLNVINDDTRAVVEEALKRDGVSSGLSPAWPGHKFTPEGNLQAFQARLGSPNVSGVAWLLLQHPEELGVKTIKSITTWDKSGMENQDAGTLPSLVIEIGSA